MNCKIAHLVSWLWSRMILRLSLGDPRWPLMILMMMIMSVFEIVMMNSRWFFRRFENLRISSGWKLEHLSNLADVRTLNINSKSQNWYFHFDANSFQLFLQDTISLLQAAIPLASSYMLQYHCRSSTVRQQCSKDWKIQYAISILMHFKQFFASVLFVFSKPLVVYDKMSTNNQTY